MEMATQLGTANWQSSHSQAPSSGEWLKSLISAEAGLMATSPHLGLSAMSTPTSVERLRAFDEYSPESDVVAPISIRTTAMELLWVCGDCGEHYPRTRGCPTECRACGAPERNFFAPIED